MVFVITFALFAFIILSKLVYSSGYLRMNPKQTYYHNEWEDPNKFPDILPWMKMGKDNMYFMSKLCKIGLVKLSTLEITTRGGHIKPSKERKPTKHQKAVVSVEKINKLSFNPIEKRVSMILPLCHVQLVQIQ